MDITKDNYFDLEYNERKNVLEMHNSKKKSIFRSHKFITTVLGTTFILVAINLYLIYKFFEILCTI